MPKDYISTPCKYSEISIVYQQSNSSKKKNPLRTQVTHNNEEGDVKGHMAMVDDGSGFNVFLQDVEHTR